MQRTVAVVNKLGLHARAAAKLVTLAVTFKSTIRLQKDGRDVSGKSIMGVMMLAAEQGSSIEVETSGPEAKAALDAITELVANRFNEGE